MGEVLNIAVPVMQHYIPFLFSLCFHEFAHAFVAKVRGDDTAQMMGRLTLNPFSHIDLFGTVAFPILGMAGGIPWVFGWAKPVPVNPRNLKDKKNDMFWVALAGPASNILLFFIGLIGLTVSYSLGYDVLRSPYGRMVEYFIVINMVLAFFNLLPFHPLDGGKILQRFIPNEWNRWLEDHYRELFIGLIAMILLGAFGYIFYPVAIFINYSVDLAIQLGVGS